MAWLDIAGCCKSASIRIGEASHPGPRAKRGFRAAGLDDVQLRTPATELLKGWCEQRIESIDIHVLFGLVPGSLCAEGLWAYVLQSPSLGVLAACSEMGAQ